MGPKPGREPPPSLPAATYWRRRFVALLAGMSVLALVAWALSGALDASRAAGGQPAHKPPHSQKSVGTTPATSHDPSPSPSAGDRTTSGAKKPAAKKTGTAHPTTGATTNTTATGKKRPTPLCPTSAVVLSLFSSQGSYGAGEEAQFQIDVVSTVKEICNFDVGASHLVLQISKGTRIVWTSAQCAEGASSLIATLHRGVPTIVPMTWDGQRSSAGCPVPGAQAGGGNYSAAAVDGALRSNAVSFRLG
jgi:hypothetical protein